MEATPATPCFSCIRDPVTVRMAAPELSAYDAVVAREAPSHAWQHGRACGRHDRVRGAGPPHWGAAIDALITSVYDRGNLQETFL